MLSQMVFSNQLLKVSTTLIIAIFSVKTVGAYTKQHFRSDHLQNVASEKVGKILNVPISPDFDTRPSMKRGLYGGHRSNFDITDDSVNEGQFGKRIILGIVENINETATSTSVPDQKKSQTIVKYFDEEDYNGIKINPIVTDNRYDGDANDIEKTRNRKEIVKSQPKTFVVNGEANDELIRSKTESSNFTVENQPRYTNEKVEDESYTENEKLVVEDETKSDKTPQKILHDTKKYNKTIDDPSNQEYADDNEPAEPQETYIQRENQDIEDQKQSHENLEYESHYDSEPHKYDNGNSDALSQGDQKLSADHSHEEIKKDKKDGKHASGKGEEYKEEKHSEKGDEGVKKYEGFHEEEKRKKGHKDEVNDGNKYTDKGGEEKQHQEEHGHHGLYHKGEEAEKESEFSEEGKHSKGHSTKGEHNIHKKDEYEKKQEFYDEHHEGGEHEKNGKFHHEENYKKGGHKMGGHHKKGNHNEHYGKKSNHEKGHFYDDKNGKKKSIGHNQHHGIDSKYGKKSGNSGKKHWGYERETGLDRKNKYKKGQEAAHSNLQQVKKLPKTVHANYKEGNEYPHYVQRIHTHNNNRRTHSVDNEDDFILKQNKRKIPTQLKQERDSSDHDQENLKNKDHGLKNERNDAQLDYLPQSSIQNEKNREPPKNSTLSLRKIYVIFPKDFEEQLQQSSKNSESLSVESASSDEDSEEEPPETDVMVYKKYKKTITPMQTESFPKEHKKRLSEIEYVVHSIGAD